MDSIEDFFDEKCRLPSPPAIALKILEAVQQEDNSFDDLARIIAADPALSVRILKIANSSLYGLVKPVNSLAQATAMIGTDALKNIALSFVIVQDFQDAPQGSFDLNLFWRRAITAAVAAEVLGKNIAFKDQDIFASALLQDIGVMILFLSDPSAYTTVLNDKRVSGKSLCTTEKEQFGYDHAEVGCHFLKSWNLPSSICQPIRFHHSEAPDEEYRQAALVLDFADKISAMYHGVRSNSKSGEVHLGLARNWHLSGEQIDRLIDAVGERAREVLDLFAIDPGEIKPFSQIMQEANEELGRLNLSYEQIVLELKQAKQSAEKLAMELKQANDSLRELAVRDGLTGLYNHRHFQEVLQAELERGGRYGHPIAMLMVDIDFFKSVNDNYGHPAGDKVLKEVSQVLVSLVRNCDFVARYGGEEFAVVLPVTGASGAKVLAQRLRRGVEQKEIEYNGKLISVTISIGLAASDLTQLAISRAALIESGDQALYRAKQNGRNRVELGTF
ncbi:MAG: GGDEF domain-containing protein [Proteobacteria bacterium]|nr:GGDEF domain-containing protein [Pseudomonadota bacterium]MBU1059128.1 GGDEF domain-containing protein [Pseudomonadota bacterium]